MRNSREVTMQQATAMKIQSSQSGGEYDVMLARMVERFRELGNVPLFTTDADPDALWNAYLTGFPDSERQFHNCSACRHFIKRFGGLVMLGEHGATTPAVFDFPELIGGGYGSSVGSVYYATRKAKVNGVFFCSDPVWGTPESNCKDGKRWTHLHVVPHPGMIFKSRTMTANQAMAEKREDHKNVMRALQEFPPALVAQALAILNSGAVPEQHKVKVIGPAQWLADLHAACEKSNRSNAVWRAVATAPAGFMHPRTSVIGSVLEDLQSGMAFETVKRRFAEKMNPLQYQRPTAAPSLGTIAQAEKLVEQLGIARSLERRFARLEEIEAIWKPTAEEKPSTGGIFDHLKPAVSGSKALSAVVGTITWEKFARTVLPTAKSAEVLVPHSGIFMAMVTAEHADAPPILQWDTEEQRNPVNHYLYPQNPSASPWNLSPGTWVKVTGITNHPATWHCRKILNHANYALMLLDCCMDSRDSGLAIFPEILKSELHGVRSVIEAHSQRGKLGGREHASACGIAVASDNNPYPVTIRVKDAVGNSFQYTIDRWD